MGLSVEVVRKPPKPIPRATPHHWRRGHPPPWPLSFANAPRSCTPRTPGPAPRRAKKAMDYRRFSGNSGLMLERMKWATRIITTIITNTPITV